jgi:antitoxin VapB
MALNIKNPEVESLASELADLTGESKTETIRQALLERKARLRLRVTEAGRKERIRRFFETEVWSRIPEDQIGRPPTKEEREEILGFGGEGV